MSGAAVDLGVVNGGDADGGVQHGAHLIAFTETVVNGEEPAMSRERTALRAVLSPQSFVDVAATIGAFNVVDRIADATGIPLDPMLEGMSVDIRRELNLTRFGSSVNTPAAT